VVDQPIPDELTRLARARLTTLELEASYAGAA
jgi:hypothetical protein